MLTADSYTLLEGDFEEDDGVESKSEQQGEVSVSVRSSSSSSFASSSTDERPELPVTRDDYLRMCQFHTVPWFQKPIARQVYDADGKSVKRLWYLRSATTYDLMLDMLFACLFIQMSKAYFGTVGLVDGDFRKAITAFIAMAIPVFTQWYETLKYLNRFDAEDVVHLIYFFYNVSAIGFLGLHLMDCSSLHYSSSCSGVVLSIGALRFGVAFMEAYSSCYNPNTRVFVGARMLRNVLISVRSRFECVDFERMHFVSELYMSLTFNGTWLFQKYSNNSNRLTSFRVIALETPTHSNTQVLWILLALILPWNCDSDESEVQSLNDWTCVPWENKVTAPLWWGILIFDFVSNACMDGLFTSFFDRSRVVPLDLDLLVERMGMMITVAIAMTVVMCTFNDRLFFFVPTTIHHVQDSNAQQPPPIPGPPGPAHGGKPDTRAATYTTMVAMLVILLKVVFFNLDNRPAPSKSRPDGPRHALTRAWFVGHLWKVLHLPLLMSIFIAGSALFDFVQMSVHEAKTSKNMPPVFQWTLSISLCVGNLVMALQQLLHVGGGKLTKRRWRKRTRVFFRILISVLLLLPPVVIPNGHPQLHVFSAIVLLAILAGVVLYARQSMDTSDELLGLSSAVAESLLAERMLSADVVYNRSSESKESTGNASRSEGLISSESFHSRSEDEVKTLRHRLSGGGESDDSVANLQREISILKQKKWALEKERDVALRRDRESSAKIRQLQSKLRETMQELEDRPPSMDDVLFSAGEGGGGGDA